MSSADLNKPAIFLGKNQWVLSKAWLWEGCGHCITLISREYLRPAQSSMLIRGELQRAGVRQHKVIYQSSKMSPRSDQWLHVLHENVSTHAAFWADCVGWHVWAYFIVSWLQDCHRYTNCGVANHLNKKKGGKKKKQVRTPVCALDLAQAGCYWYLSFLHTRQWKSKFFYAHSKFRLTDLALLDFSIHKHMVANYVRWENLEPSVHEHWKYSM